MAQAPRRDAGTLITFEGVDGAGKTTQLRALGVWLRQKGLDVVETREPGGTPIAEGIRDVLLAPEHARMSRRAELFLVLAARAEHVEARLAPALEAGQTVLCDRFTDATVAYQGGGREFPADLIAKMNDFAACGIRPDLTFILDVEPTVGLKRINRRAAPSDRFEGETPAFYKRVREGYQRIAKRDRDRVVLVDASGSMAVIQDKIRGEVVRRKLAES